MLTRLEIQGFKNLLDVTVDLGPFTCIAGPNGIGKSNVFDAIEFLSATASGTLVEAAQRVRGAGGLRGGDPRDLFWDGYRNEERTLRLAAEMLVPRVVTDDLGGEAEATTTFLRYELHLGYERSAGQGSIGRLTLLKEELTHITLGAAAAHLHFPHSAAQFRSAVVTGRRSGGAFLSTSSRDDGTVVNLHGDGGSRGKPMPRAAGRVGRTFLSSVTTTEYPTILAARREMESWQRVALEPSALRAPSDFSAPRALGTDGRNIASTLYRIAHEADVEPERVYGRIAGRLQSLTGLHVSNLDVEVDEVREVFTIFLTDRGGIRLPARALSEGTLRFLALCVLLEDPASQGLVCMEEPENGIHPANLEAILDLVRDLAVDPAAAPGDGNVLRQVVVNTHSPAVVRLCDPEDLLLADLAWVEAPGREARALTLRPYRETWRSGSSASGTFSQADVLDYLTLPVGQLSLDLAS